MGALIQWAEVIAYGRAFISAILGLCVVACLSGCLGGGGSIAVPKLQPGDRVIVQYDRSERALDTVRGS